MSAALPAPPRRILVLTHVGRPNAVAAGNEMTTRLLAAGATVVVPVAEWKILADAASAPAERAAVEVLHGAPEVAAVVAAGIDAVVVLGGDGTILRAAELVRGSEVPLLGVNLGHVGFLAESDPELLSQTVTRLVAGDYAVEERMTADFRVWCQGRPIHEGWALNEVSIEKAARERMLDVVVEVDRRPLTRFGCDGVVVATPTGSTAYSFSAGGPVVWPEVEALLVTPISAHALFARPLVVGVSSIVAIETFATLSTEGVLWADGRRMFVLPPASRIEVRRGVHPVRLARLNRAAFTERLVNRFRLPVSGWRGPTGGVMGEGPA